MPGAVKPRNTNLFFIMIYLLFFLASPEYILSCRVEVVLYTKKVAVNPPQGRFPSSPGCVP